MILALICDRRAGFYRLIDLQLEIDRSSVLRLTARVKG